VQLTELEGTMIMTKQRSWYVGLLIAAAILAGAVTVDAQPTGVGPYYSTPSWDQTFPSASRFMILSNFASAAILDRETGLVWERTPETAVVDWFNALVACAGRTTGGRKAWRLPSLHELQSLIDPSVPFPGPTLPAGHPFQTSTYLFFWTGTSTGTPPNLAWGVWFGMGEVNMYVKDGTPNPNITLRAWCVRGPSAESLY